MLGRYLNTPNHVLYEVLYWKRCPVNSAKMAIMRNGKDKCVCAHLCVHVWKRNLGGHYTKQAKCRKRKIMGEMLRKRSEVVEFFVYLRSYSIVRYRPVRVSVTMCVNFHITFFSIHIAYILVYICFAIYSIHFANVGFYFLGYYSLSKYSCLFLNLEVLSLCFQLRVNKCQFLY